MLVVAILHGAGRKREDLILYPHLHVVIVDGFLPCGGDDLGKFLVVYIHRDIVEADVRIKYREDLPVHGILLRAELNGGRCTGKGRIEKFVQLRKALAVGIVRNVLVPVYDGIAGKVFPAADHTLVIQKIAAVNIVLPPLVAAQIIRVVVALHHTVVDLGAGHLQPCHRIAVLQDLVIQRIEHLGVVFRLPPHVQLRLRLRLGGRGGRQRRLFLHRQHKIHAAADQDQKQCNGKRDPKLFHAPSPDVPPSAAVVGFCLAPMEARICESVLP